MFVVESMPVEAVRALRLDVLRRGTPSSDVVLPGDEDPGTRHLAIRSSDGRVVATSTWLDSTWIDPSDSPDPSHAAGRALQLRGMAVADDHRRLGLGALLVEAGIDLARERNARWIWANARDAALDFYRSRAFVVVGDGFVTQDTLLPHHRVVLAVPPRVLSRDERC